MKHKISPSQRTHSKLSRVAPGRYAVIQWEPGNWDVWRDMACVDAGCYTQAEAMDAAYAHAEAYAALVPTC